MFQHVGISWIIQYRDKSTFFLRGSIILRFKMGLGIIQKYFHICVAVLLNISFHCHIKTGTILYVLSICITTFMHVLWFLLVLDEVDCFHMGQQLMCWSLFMTLLTSLTYGYKNLWKTMFGIGMCTKKNELVIQADSFNNAWAQSWRIQEKRQDLHKDIGGGGGWGLCQ